MEEKKAKGTFGFYNAREEDMISKLPNSLISQILLYLPTKEAVRTSVLSNTWKSLWLLIPELDLDSSIFSDYNDFASFIERYLDFFKEENLCLQKLKLSVYKDEKDNRSSLTRWIDFVATAPTLKHLDVECFVKRNCLEVMHVSLFICETLLDLRLCEVLFGSSFEDSSSVSLPRLNTIRLEWKVYANERSLESFISSCHVLEDLSIVRREVDDNVKVLRVCSQTLTNLSLKYCYELEDDKEAVVDILLGEDLYYEQLEIDAPRLEYLNLENEMSYSKTIRNSGSLTKVNILGEFYLKDSDDQVGKFFTILLGVKDLKISIDTLWYIKDMVPLPQSCNLSCLEAQLGFDELEKVPMLLASCPNLRSLILDLLYPSGRKQVRLSSVPQCLMTSLEFVEIKCRFNTDHIIELVRYFAENSVILKKLVLRLVLEENSVVLSDLLALPRRSNTCQIIVC